LKTNIKLLLTTGYRLCLAIDYQINSANTIPLETGTNIAKGKTISSTKRKNESERGYTQTLGEYLTIITLFLFKKQRTSRKRHFRLPPRLFWDVTHRRLTVTDVLAQPIGPISRVKQSKSFGTAWL